MNYALIAPPAKSICNPFFNVNAGIQIKNVYCKQKDPIGLEGCHLNSDRSDIKL